MRLAPFVIPLIPLVLQAQPQQPSYVPVITVTIPAGTVTRTDTDGTSVTYRASVGTARYHTPRGSFRVTEITWNPEWNPPSSPWASKRLRALPGNSNPMGRVKMQFDDLLYLHGTPPNERAHLGRPASHGCVRLANEDAWDLARWLVQVGGADITDSTMSSLEAGASRTKVRPLYTPVDVIIRYPVADIVQDHVQTYPDPYLQFTWAQRRAELVKVLTDAGVAPIPERVDQALRAAKTRPVVWALTAFTDATVPAVDLMPSDSPPRNRPRTDL